MPFKSESQRRFLWKFHPDIAQRWAHEYTDKPRMDRVKSKAQKYIGAVGKKLPIAAMTLALAGFANCLCTPSQAEIDRTYQAEVVACAERPSRAEAERCRTDVKVRWGVDSGSE